MASEKVQEFTDANFDSEVLKSSQPVLVDFWAPWCAPCRKMMPIIDALATDFEGKAKIGKVNIDDNQASAAKFGIQAIPTLLIFKEGRVQKMLQGTVSKQRLQEELDALVV